MKSLAFFALTAVATAAMATGNAPMGVITISGTSAQTVTVNGGNVKNTANDYTYANQNIASNKGGITISGKSMQTSSLQNSDVTNEAKLNGDVAVQNLASNVGNVKVEGPYKASPIVKGSSSQTANVTDSTVRNVAKGEESCFGFNCRDAALAYQNLSSNMGDITISGSSVQRTNVSGDSLVSNKADGPQTVAVQNVASNYGTVTISGSSSQVAAIGGGAVVANLARGRNALAAQNLASNDSCMPPPPVCVGPACGPYAFYQAQ